MLLLLLLIISITFAIMIGSVSITPLYVWKVIFSKIPFFQNWIEQDWSRSQEIIIWQIRVPRVLLAAIVGGGLAIAGAAIQALVRNSIADPYILGVSSGATVGATAVIILGAFSFFLAYTLYLSQLFFRLINRDCISVFLVACWRAYFYFSFITGRNGGILYFICHFELYINDVEARGGHEAVMYWMLGSLQERNGVTFSSRWLFLSLYLSCFGSIIEI